MVFRPAADGGLLVSAGRIVADYQPGIFDGWLGDEADLYTQTVWAEDFRWVSLPMQSSPLPVTAKTRYSQGEAAAMLYPEGENRVRVVFDAPQRAVTQGQSLVVYIGDAVAGGGIICQAE